MPFVKGDKNINRAGRTPKSLEKKKSNRELKEQELLLLLRKFRPHVAESIMTAVNIMKNKESADVNRLKSVTIVLDTYRKLVMDLYDGEDVADDEGQEVQDSSAVFSLRVLDNSEEK